MLWNSINVSIKICLYCTCTKWPKQSTTNKLSGYMGYLNLIKHDYSFKVIVGIIYSFKALGGMINYRYDVKILCNIYVYVFSGYFNMLVNHSYYPQILFQLDHLIFMELYQ